MFLFRNDKIIQVFANSFNNGLNVCEETKNLVQNIFNLFLNLLNIPGHEGTNREVKSKLHL